MEGDEENDDVWDFDGLEIDILVDGVEVWIDKFWKIIKYMIKYEWVRVFGICVF